MHALATALADQALRRAGTSVLPGVPSGWRNVPNARQQVGYQVAERRFGVEYGIRGPFVDAAVDGVELGPVLLHGCTAAEVDLQIDGVRRLVTVARAGDVRYAASALGATTLVEQPRFPETQQQATAGSLLAPMPGTVVRVEAQLGDAVHAGQVLVVLEAMKMEHSVRTPHEGTLARLNVSAGQTVDVGTVLAVVENATGSPADGASGRMVPVTEQPVRYEVVDGVAWLTINRPETRNALNKAVRDGLFAGVHRFNADGAAKVLVLTGAGDAAFCAGGDLKEMAEVALQVPPPDFLPLFGRNIEVAKPTIAAVNGLALAGGFLLAQMCDLCVAADQRGSRSPR